MYHNYKLLIAAFSVLLIFCAPSYSDSKITQDATPANFSFALIGDLAYIPTQEKNLNNVLDEIKQTPLAFVVHDGDLSSPPFGSCSDELLQKRFAQFQALPQPVIYTPGDNEWADCHTSEGVIGGDPLERLTKLRATFFENDKLAKNKLQLTHQSQTDTAFKQYSENVRWVYGNVLFITLHVVGSNNNLGRTTEDDAEYKERNTANLAWLSEGFAQARKNNNRAVMIIQQANIFPDFPPFMKEPDDKPSGFTQLRELLEKETIAFKKPVVTKVEPAAEFYAAEEYHQKYLVKNPGGYNCHVLRN